MTENENTSEEQQPATSVPASGPDAATAPLVEGASAELTQPMPATQALSPTAPSAQPPERPAPNQSSNRFEDVVSGRFDADEESELALPGKRVLAPVPESPKLHKVLAQSGMGSRLEMEQLIMEGRITVNNEPAHIGQRIQHGDQVKVNGRPIRFRVDAPPARVLAYHKPVGEVVTHDDPQNRPTVFRRLPKLQQGKWQSVGRLDLNTEGLLLFTSSGELANSLMHPRFGLEREYAVRVLGALDKEERQRLLEGVKLDDGMAQFGTIEDGGGEGSNCWYRVTISEGRNREVRRMFEAVGHAVSRLIRIRYGAMLLPRGLKRGAFMELDAGDIQALRAASGAKDPAFVRQTQGQGQGPGQGPGRGRGAAPGAQPAGPGNRNNPRRGGRGGNGDQRAPDGPRDVRDGRGLRDGAPHAGAAGFPNGMPGAGKGRNRPRPDQGDSGARADRMAAESQPDPMKTAFGYIGADSFTRQRQGAGRGGARGGAGTNRGPGVPGGQAKRRGGRGR